MTSEEVRKQLKKIIRKNPYKPLCIKENDFKTGSYTYRFVVLNIKSKMMYEKWRTDIEVMALNEIIIKNFGNNFTENQTERTRATRVIYQSLDQICKPKAGNIVRDMTSHFFSLVGISNKIEKNGIDITVDNLLNGCVSVKRTMRDRVNDKDCPIQVLFIADCSLKTFKNFKRKKAIVIIVNPASLFNARRKLKLNKIKLKLYSLDEGIKEIKYKLDENFK